jgi:hypothetical protein
LEADPVRIRIHAPVRNAGASSSICDATRHAPRSHVKT